MPPDIDKIAKELSPILEKMEQERVVSLAASKNSIIYAGICLLSTVLFIYMMLGASFFIALLCLVLLIVAMVLFVININNNTFGDSYQNVFLPQIIAQVYPKATFQPEHFLTPSLYKKAIGEGYLIDTIWSGMYLTTGSQGNSSSYSFSKIDLKKGKKATKILYQIKLSKHFNSTFYFTPYSNPNPIPPLEVPNIFSKTPSSKTFKSISIKTDKEPIQIRGMDIEFSKRFLSKKLTKILAALNDLFHIKKSNPLFSTPESPLQFSFVEDTFFVLVNDEHNLLKINWNQKINNKDYIHSLVNEIRILHQPIDLLIPILEQVVNDLIINPVILEQKKDQKEDLNNDFYDHLIL